MYCVWFLIAGAALKFRMCNTKLILESRVILLTKFYSYLKLKIVKSKSLTKDM